MILIENTEVFGWEAALRGMRNPMNSWERSDSFQCDSVGCFFEECPEFHDGGCSKEGSFVAGNNDRDLMARLAKGGPVHAKYRRMIMVTCDITAPLYWLKEWDTYKVGTVANSCSTMHKIHADVFSIDDFSHEHLDDVSLGYLADTISRLNDCREAFLKTNDKADWWQMIQLLPSSYNQRRTVQLNYEVLASMYRDRRNHKLDEWRGFCSWIETLPYSWVITGEVESDG